jgi:predicted ATPase
LRLTTEKALQRSAYQEAIGLLGRALGLLPRLPETSERTAAELDLQIALGQVLTVTQGPGAAEVARVYARAEALCQQSATVQQRIAVMRGLRRVMEGRGEPTKAQPLAEEFLGLAQETGDTALLIEGHVAIGVCSFYRGRVPTAHSQFREGLTIYDAERPQAYNFPAGQDLSILALAYDAMALWVLGYPQQALERSGRALHLAEDVAQPWAQATASGYAAVMCAWRGERQAALDRAEATIKLATEYDVSSWIGRGMMLRGWALAEQGRQDEGLDQIQQGLETWQANGQELGKPFWLALLGEGYARAAQVERGLGVIAEGLAMAQERDLRVWEAELHRLRGELWLQSARGEEWRAEACFRQAIDVALRQQATSLELRATVSLCRVWQRQGMQDAARQLLTACYHRFSEGFDSGDLQEARGLLARLDA